MSFLTFRSRYFGFAAFISLVLCILLVILFKSRSYDDPFITYRYADNLRRGFGFVYNPGEYVQSTTAPLFALLLAGLSPLWGDLPRLANLIGAVSLAAGGLLLWELAAAWKAPWAGWAGLILYPLFPLAITTIGSETPLYIALCLGAFVAYTRQRYHWTAVFAALAALTRPDGLLVSIILAADYTIRLFREKAETRSTINVGEKHRGHAAASSIPWRAILVFFGLLLPWFLFAWAYFGSPLPVTLAAKQQQGAMAVSQRFAQGFLSTLGWYKSWRYELEAVLAVLGLVFVISRVRQWLLFLAWPVLYFAAFSFLGVSRYFWYYTPLVPGFLLLAGLGMQAIAGMPMRLRSGVLYRPLRWNNVAPIFKDLPTRFHLQTAQFLSIIILIILGLAQARALPRLQRPDPRFAIYSTVGRWLSANTPLDATVGSLEVGIIGYYAHRPMVDFAGLIQPMVATQLTSGSNYEHAASWAVEYYQPNYLVLFPGDFPQLEQGYVAQHCRLDKTFVGDNFSFDRDLSVYDCQ